MIEDLHISVPLNEVPEAQVGNYFTLSQMLGEFLIIQKPDNTFYFLCSRECDIVRICESFDWYIVSKDAFNDRLCIGIGLADKESIDGEVYRVQDEATLSLWRDILARHPPLHLRQRFRAPVLPLQHPFQGQDAHRRRIVLLHP